MDEKVAHLHLPAPGAQCWWCTVQMMTVLGQDCCYQLVDDGGDATLLMVVRLPFYFVQATHLQAEATRL